MNNLKLIYIDQNLLQYDFEEKINISTSSEIQWVFSDEHFSEINRKVDERFFAVLKRLKARKIKIILDDKFKFTDDCVLLEYKDPRFLFDDYIETISEYNETSNLFLPLQAFFSGNLEALDPKSYTAHFKRVILDLLKDAFNEIDKPGVESRYINLLESDEIDIGEILDSAKSQIKPLNEQRKIISLNKQFSDLKAENGLIIDQIWEVIAESMQPITKNQFFGKAPLPYSQVGDSSNEQPLFLGIVQCHTVLNHLGYWPDEGLPKISKILGINSDAAHIAYAYFCNGIASADNRLCKKANAIYDYFGKPNAVLKVKLD